MTVVREVDGGLETITVTLPVGNIILIDLKRIFFSVVILEGLLTLISVRVYTRFHSIIRIYKLLLSGSASY